MTPNVLLLPQVRFFFPGFLHVGSKALKVSICTPPLPSPPLPSPPLPSPPLPSPPLPSPPHPSGCHDQQPAQAVGGDGAGSD